MELKCFIKLEDEQEMQKKLLIKMIIICAVKFLFRTVMSK